MKVSACTPEAAEDVPVPVCFGVHATIKSSREILCTAPLSCLMFVLVSNRNC